MHEGPNIEELQKEKIVSFKDVENISSVELMDQEILIQILQRVTLLNSEIHPYEKSIIEYATLDSKSLLFGQTFVEKSKINNLEENLNNFLKNYTDFTKFTELDALIINGTNSKGELVTAYYLPPVVEQHNDKYCVIDGAHRCYIANKEELPINIILIRNAIKPPCTFDVCEKIKLVKKKPKFNKRWRNLKKHLFRDFKKAGIDG